MKNQWMIMAIIGLALFFIGMIVLSTPSAPSNDAIVDEALRLSGIAQDRNLTTTDFSTLEELVKDHHVLAHETEEAIWMVDHELPHHVNHTLNAIISIAKTGEYVCPADSLSHIRPFLDYNEMEKAIHVLGEGKAAMPKWKEKVFLARQKNPEAYPDADTLIIEMQATITTFELGKLNESREHSLYLEENGYC